MTGGPACGGGISSDNQSIQSQVLDDATNFDYHFNDPSFNITLNFNPVHVSYAFYFTQIMEQKEEMNL